jgi:hypothetical protein
MSANRDRPHINITISRDTLEKVDNLSVENAEKIGALGPVWASRRTSRSRTIDCLLRLALENIDSIERKRDNWGRYL